MLADEKRTRPGMCGYRSVDAFAVLLLSLRSEVAGWSGKRESGTRC